MCGRFVQSMTVEQLAELYGISGPLPNAPPRYNLAPTQSALVVRFNPETAKRQVDLLHFGLLPSWAKDRKIAMSGINARSETVAEKPMFRNAFAKRRAVVPADAYYEWKVLGPREKQPYAFASRSGKPLSLAALWENWQDPGTREWVRSFSLITTAPNAVAAAVHDRMPVILRDEDLGVWLGETPGDPAALLRPAPDDWLRAYPVDKRVGKVANDDAALLEPIVA